MAIQKHYVIDTNVLLEDPDALSKLRNGNENKIYIPYHVLKGEKSRGPITDLVISSAL